MEFEDAIEYVLKWEGGYSNNLSDPGGETNFGICKRDHPSIDIKNLTREQAIEIYRKEYWEPNLDVLECWNPVGCAIYHFFLNEIPNRLFDSIINTGRNTTIKLLQRALNVSTSYAVQDDGVFGPQTKTSIISCARKDNEWKEFLSSFKSERAAYYRVLAAKDPSQEKFLKGWLTRAYS